LRFFSEAGRESGRLSTAAPGPPIDLDQKARRQTD
jgi:hypothetical protein